MRSYIDTRGRFRIDIPDHWNCREEHKDNGNPVTFMFGDDSEDCFQISCIPKNNGRVPYVLSRHEFYNNEYSKPSIIFLQRDIDMDVMNVTVFEAKVKDHFILALHTSSKEEGNSNIIQKHIDEINQSLKTFLVVDPSQWEQFAAHARFHRFMVSLLASIDLTNKAQEKGSSIELVILYANRIDALLRLALILKEQLRNSTDTIDSKLIFQDEGDKPIFEKDIYKLAFDNDLIDESLFKTLNGLYDLRNRVVHRYIISYLKTNDIIELVVKYMDIYEIVGNKVGALEKEQFEKGVGIYGKGSDPTHQLDISQVKGLITELHDKHANKKIIEGMTINLPKDDNESLSENR